MTQAHTTSWIHSLAPTSASWAVVATELASLFFIAAVVFGWFALRAHKQKISAARALLNERNRIADSATETMAMHLKALLSGQEPSEDALDDYRERTRELIGKFCEPWLNPSKSNLRDGVHAVLALRHTDLHQLASLLGGDQKTVQVDDSAVKNLQQDLNETKKAEALRSKQLQEALTTIGTMVAEYGRKFDASTDHRAGQILRALIYLEALDDGNDEARAREIVDETLSEDLEVMNQAPADDKPATPAPEAVAAAAAAEAEDLSDELDAEEVPEADASEAPEEYPEGQSAEDAMAAAMAAEAAEKSTAAETASDSEPEAEEPAAEAETPAATEPEPEAEPEPASAATSDDANFEDLDDIDAMISQAQSDIEAAAEPTVAAQPAAEAQTPAQPEQAATEKAEPTSGQPAAEAQVPAEPQGPAEQAPAPATGEESASKAEAEKATPAETPPPADKSGDDNDISDIVDLDEVELPKPPEPPTDTGDETSSDDDNGKNKGDKFDLDLDDIDALLDAEIARHQTGSDSEESSADEDDLDLSK